MREVIAALYAEGPYTVKGQNTSVDAESSATAPRYQTPSVRAAPKPVSWRRCSVRR
ncbi:MAG: hypothetical protein L0Z47_09185 [Actinobacteria bacterium]|nr:hypothetical protein [Actinomycetota bacterium]